LSLRLYGQRLRGIVRQIVLRTTLLAVLSAPLVAAADNWTWHGVARVVAISDVHGAYDAMLKTLDNAGILGAGQEWTGADTHLVITGDLLDRGPDSRQVMDLIMRLETEATAAGGRVHLLLGNHEAMNLVGDLRYVSRAEYAAFAAEETAEEREHWFGQFRAEQADAGDETAMRAAFADAAPPGFFAHRRAFRADGHYGAWLLQKPLMVIIDGTAFVHGGVSPMIGEIGLAGVNERLANELHEYVTQLASLTDAGLMTPLQNFYEHDQLLESLPADVVHAPEITAAIATVIRLNGSKIHASDGPLWYRGSVGCGPLIETDRLDRTLAVLQATRVVIGHTPTLTRRVLQRLDGRVIEIDTGMLRSSYNGSGNALIIEDGELAVVNEGSSAILPVAEHPRRVGLRAESLSAGDLQEILANGELVSSNTDMDGIVTVEVASGEYKIAAVFAKNPRSKGFVPELAAYRLDRLLDLGMVPVTVARQVDGAAGTLQFLPSGTMNEAERAAVRRGASAWCPIPDQWGDMYIFDSLIFNPGRNPQHMVYSSDNWQLILTGHGESFSTKRGRPPYLKEIELALGDSWQAALRRLDDTSLREHFSDVLDKRRLNALSRRRDELLQN